MQPRLSIIIPALNEAAALAVLLPALRRDCPGAEIIVADGGSDDETLAIAQDGDRAVSVPAGRASQMNAGAAVATGSVLWFLHADSTPPPDAPAHIEQILASGCCGGCFRIWFAEPAWVFRIGDALSNLKVDLIGIAYGDHGIFCTAEAFHHVGGYPPVPLLEDADLYRALGRSGGVRQAPAYIVTSARRYHAHGPWRTTFIYLALSTLYMLGCPRDFIVRWHERLLPPEAAKPRRATSRERVSL